MDRKLWELWYIPYYGIFVIMGNAGFISSTVWNIPQIQGAFTPAQGIPGPKEPTFLGIFSLYYDFLTISPEKGRFFGVQVFP